MKSIRITQSAQNTIFGCAVCLGTLLIFISVDFSSIPTDDESITQLPKNLEPLTTVPSWAQGNWEGVNNGFSIELSLNPGREVLLRNGIATPTSPNKVDYFYSEPQPQVMGRQLVITEARQIIGAEGTVVTTQEKNSIVTFDPTQPEIAEYSEVGSSKNIELHKKSFP
jgi:hypothetical protein